VTQNAAESSALDPDLAGTERAVDLTWWATWVGLIFAGVAFISGLVMALEKKVITCPDGTYFPEGATDLECYVHPDGAIGIAVAALSIVLGVLVLLMGSAARSGLQAGAPRL
jgi:hypothetical protein